MIGNIILKFKKIDFLVNNAGITADNFFTKIRIDEWEDVINVNLNGTFYCIREVVPHMIKQNYGRIVNISSIVSERSGIAQSNYAASKAGIDSLTKSLAKELGSYGINVNSVLPGLIKTQMLDSIPQKILNKHLDMIPLKRVGESKEIADAVIFFLSDYSSYCNGATLNVDGGLRL